MQQRGIFAHRTIRNIEFGSQTDTVVDLGTQDVAMQTDIGRACSPPPLMLRLALSSDVVIPISDWEDYTDIRTDDIAHLPWNGMDRTMDDGIPHNHDFITPLSGFYRPLSCHFNAPSTTSCLSHSGGAGCFQQPALRASLAVLLNLVKWPGLV